MPFGSGRRNPRQIELAERLEEMLEFACWYQSALIKKIGEKKFHEQNGIPIKIFLAKYGIKFKVGHYARQRYFSDYVLAGIFIKNGKSFEVWETEFKNWLELLEG